MEDDDYTADDLAEAARPLTAEELALARAARDAMQREKLAEVHRTPAARVVGEHAPPRRNSSHCRISDFMVSLLRTNRMNRSPPSTARRSYKHAVGSASTMKVLRGLSVACRRPSKAE